MRKLRYAVGLKTAIAILVLSATLLTALPLQWVWWQTARQSSLELVDALSHQIASTVRREWWERVVAAEAAHATTASLLDGEPREETVSRAMRAAFAATKVPSALALADQALGPVLATRGDNGEVTIHLMRGPRPEGDMPSGETASGWREVVSDPASSQPAIAFAGSSSTSGSLSLFIGMDRFAELLGAIAVGRTGAAFVVDARGSVRIGPDDAATGALRRVATEAAAIVAARASGAVNIVESRRLLLDGAAYRVSLSPLEFNGWQLAVIVPEAEFLSGIEMTTRNALISLVGLSLLLGMVAAALAQRVLSEPVSALTADLRKIEQFDLEGIAHKPSHLREFDHLSAAMTRMATGLADFAKFIPTDLVRMLLANGVRAVPGGETRELTLMFADVAGFTKISERMGTAVIDVASRYLDVVSHSVEKNGGTIDKFIGDAVMAFWGAPRLDSEQAANACRTALAAIADVRASGILDDRGQPLKIRVGIHSGTAVVGNIGSARRLNYTAIGDTVNLASRLEGVNKIFGTSILISEATRLAAGDGFITRELAEVAVSGRTEPVRVHELVEAGGMPVSPSWIKDYEHALQSYRNRDFSQAIALLEQVLRIRPGDGPSIWLKAICQTCLASPPPADWRGVTILDMK